MVRKLKKKKKKMSIEEAERITGGLEISLRKLVTMRITEEIQKNLNENLNENIHYEKSK